MFEGSILSCRGGPRKCLGDQFALLESVVMISVIFRRFEFELVGRCCMLSPLTNLSLLLSSSMFSPIPILLRSPHLPACPPHRLIHLHIYIYIHVYAQASLCNPNGAE